MDFGIYRHALPKWIGGDSHQLHTSLTSLTHLGSSESGRGAAARHQPSIAGRGATALTNLTGDYRAEESLMQPCCNGARPAQEPRSPGREGDWRWAVHREVLGAAIEQREQRPRGAKYSSAEESLVQASQPGGVCERAKVAGTWVRLVSL